MSYLPLGRGRIEVPPITSERYIQYADALEEPLAESYGTVVVGISGQHDLHELFASQATHLLHNITPELAGSGLAIALRTIRAVHKHEQPFSDERTTDEQTSARVLVPYTPQYGCMTKEETEIDRPLHMTFGLLRSTADAVHVARTNIWVCRDDQALKPSFRAVKDTNTHRTFETHEEANEFFVKSRKRSRARASFVVSRMLENAD